MIKTIYYSMENIKIMCKTDVGTDAYKYNQTYLKLIVKYDFFGVFEKSMIKPFSVSMYMYMYM